MAHNQEMIECVLQGVRHHLENCKRWNVEFLRGYIEGYSPNSNVVAFTPTGGYTIIIVVNGGANPKQVELALNSKRPSEMN